MAATRHRAERPGEPGQQKAEIVSAIHPIHARLQARGRDRPPTHCACLIIGGNVGTCTAVRIRYGPNRTNSTRIPPHPPTKLPRLGRPSRNGAWIQQECDCRPDVPVTAIWPCRVAVRSAGKPLNPTTIWLVYRTVHSTVFARTARALPHMTTTAFLLQRLREFPACKPATPTDPSQACTHQNMEAKVPLWVCPVHRHVDRG